jgi:dolichyl-phosphate-mannose-protein mannosyltransferase
MKESTRRHLALVLAALLLILFLAEGAAFIAANSQTSDEAVHLTAGYSYLARGDFRLNPEHPPFIKEISALPVYLFYQLPFDPDPRLWRAAEEWRIGRDFLYRSSIQGDRILALGRIPNLLLGCFLAGLAGWWGYRLWGRGAGLTALALCVLEPNLITHASLVTTDMGAALFIFLAVYLLWEYAAAPSWRALLGIGAACGLALASKYSTVILGAILACVGLVHLLGGGALPLPGQAGRKLKGGVVPRILQALPAAAVAGIVILLVLPACYRLQGFDTWWTGLHRVLTHQEAGHNAFFMGEYSTEGWWSYFPVAFLIKTPLGSLALILASLLATRAGKRLSRREASFLLLPVAILFAGAMQGRINIGLRHILPIYPFLFVAASRAATFRFRRPAMKWLALGIPMAATAVSSLHVAPHDLAYFNEAIGGPGNGYLYLSDSNIDWGQDLKGVKAFMDREGVPMIYLAYFGNTPPSVYGIRYQYVPAFGRLEPPPDDTIPPGNRRDLLAISVTALQAVHFEDKNLYRWLYSRKPVERIGYSIHVYDLTGDAEAHFRLAEAYMKVGPRSLALPELRRVLAIDPSNAEAARLLASLAPGS